MKEQDEAHSFEETPKWVTDYNANRQAVNVLEAELTSLRSELQQERYLRKELVNACEGVIRLRQLLEFTEDVAGTAHEGEAIAINRMIFVIEMALEKSKAKF